MLPPKQICFAELERLIAKVEKGASAEGAHQLLRIVKSIAPALPEPYIRVGVVFRNLKLHQDAGFAVLRALALSPGNAVAHYQLGLLRAKHRNFAGAESSSLFAIENEPDWADAHLLLARSRSMLLNEKAAADSYARAAELRPGWANPYFVHGGNLFIRGKFSAAQLQLMRAIYIKPDWHEAQFVLGRVLLRLGRDRDAQAAFRCAESLNPLYRKEIELLAFTLTPARIRALLKG